jgi:hypothetical protein
LAKAMQLFLPPGVQNNRSPSINGDSQ